MTRPTRLQEAYSADNFQSQGHELIDLLTTFLTNQTQREEKTFPRQTPDEALRFWQADFQQPLLENTNELYQNVFAKSVRLHNPKFVGHQVTAPLPTASLAELVLSFLNNSPAIFEMSMVSSPLERIVTNWFAQKIGYDKNSYGLLTSGGTLANLTALLTARAMKAPEEVWSVGMQSRLAIMVCEQAHYCVERAAKIMGLGDAGVIKIPSNEYFQMNTACLEAELVKAKADGLTVFAIVASACSTSTGAYDDIVSVADFAEKNNIWLHVDGAHGGVAVLSEKYKPLVRGIERADSVIVDFHKMLMIPALTTGVFYKNTSDSFQTFQQKASYLFADQEEDWYNGGKRTFECTKTTMVLKIYAVLRTYGESIFTEAVEYLYDLGAIFAKMLLETGDFELACSPQCNIVCFRFVEKNNQNLNDLNRRIKEKLLENGDFYLVQTILHEQFYMRTSLMNPLTTVRELSKLIRDIQAIRKAFGNES